jgi:hypothetical protein
MIHDRQEPMVIELCFEVQARADGQRRHGRRNLGRAQPLSTTPTRALLDQASSKPG